MGQHTSWTQVLTQYKPDPVLAAGITFFWSRLKVSSSLLVWLSLVVWPVAGEKSPFFPQADEGPVRLCLARGPTTTSLFSSISNGTGPDWKSRKHIHVSRIFLAKSEPTWPHATGNPRARGCPLSLLWHDQRSAGWEEGLETGRKHAPALHALLPLLPLSPWHIILVLIWSPPHLACVSCFPWPFLGKAKKGEGWGAC